MYSCLVGFRANQNGTGIGGSTAISYSKKVKKSRIPFFTYWAKARLPTTKIDKFRKYAPTAASNLMASGGS